MPIVNVKLSPPVYNSDRDVPPYAEWYEKFLQFVAYNDGGDAIIALINCALGREDTVYIHETSAIPDALRLGQAEVEQMLALTAGGEERAVESYVDLTAEEQSLDRDLYSVLSQCVTGQHRLTLGRVQFPSFVQAWCILAHELGATNVRRKADLIAQLLKLKFKGDVPRFKVETTALLNSIFNSGVTIHDICMHSIMMAMPADLAALRLVQTESLESEHKTYRDVHMFLETATTSLEITGHGQPKRDYAYNTTATACQRCGRSNHTTEECYATRHINGTELPPIPESTARKRNGRKPRDQANKTASVPSVIDESKAQCLEDAKALFKRMEQL